MVKLMRLRKMQAKALSASFHQHTSKVSIRDALAHAHAQLDMLH